jgi:hypothetical protein
VCCVAEKLGFEIELELYVEIVRGANGAAPFDFAKGKPDDN